MTVLTNQFGDTISHTDERYGSCVISIKELGVVKTWCNTNETIKYPLRQAKALVRSVRMCKCRIRWTK